MTPYASYLRIKYFKLIVRLPIQVLLLLQNFDQTENDDVEKEISEEEKETLSSNITVLKWDKLLEPTNLKIDWGFCRLLPEKQKIIDDYIDGVSSEH